MSKLVEKRSSYQMWKHTDVRQDTVYITVPAPALDYVKVADPLFDHPVVYGKGQYVWDKEKRQIVGV